MAHAHPLPEDMNPHTMNKLLTFVRNAKTAKCTKIALLDVDGDAFHEWGYADVEEKDESELAEEIYAYAYEEAAEAKVERVGKFVALGFRPKKTKHEVRMGFWIPVYLQEEDESEVVARPLAALARPRDAGMPRELEEISEGGDALVSGDPDEGGHVPNAIGAGNGHVIAPRGDAMYFMTALLGQMMRHNEVHHKTQLAERAQNSEMAKDLIEMYRDALRDKNKRIQHLEGAYHESFELHERLRSEEAERLIRLGQERRKDELLQFLQPLVMGTLVKVLGPDTQIPSANGEGGTTSAMEEGLVQIFSQLDQAQLQTIVGALKPEQQVLFFQYAEMLQKRADAKKAAESAQAPPNAASQPTASSTAMTSNGGQAREPNGEGK